MARVLTVPAARLAPNGTLLWWGGVILAGSLLLPWHRPGRDLFTFLPEATGLALALSSPVIVAILLLGLAVVLTALLPRPDAARGRLAAVVGGMGALMAIGYLIAAGRPFSAGGVVTILGFTSVLGTGLALSGLLRVDAFLAGCILWVSVFVLVFILYPLWMVLQASVVVKGQLTLAVVVDTLTSPGFLLVNNPGTPRDETTIALWVGAAVTVLAGAFLLRRRGGLLAERSQLRTRRLLGPFSILPIITPPFVLGLAMIYLFGRRGFVTYGLLGISTGVFFGPVGVAVAQILAFAPIAYLVLQGVVQALDAALEEAAETLGASRWHVLRTVVWPLARPGIANAFLLVAIESLADFG